jgi:hypothetical protein
MAMRADKSSWSLWQTCRQQDTESSVLYVAFTRPLCSLDVAGPSDSFLFTLLNIFLQTKNFPSSDGATHVVSILSWRICLFVVSPGNLCEVDRGGTSPIDDPVPPEYLRPKSSDITELGHRLPFLYFTSIFLQFFYPPLPSSNSFSDSVQFLSFPSFNYLSSSFLPHLPILS